MKVFLDSEFTGLHQNTTFISLALVNEYGSVFYAEFTDYDKTQMNEWLQKNVIDNLIFEKLFSNNTKHFSDIKNNHMLKDTKENIVIALKEWLADYEDIEIWSDCLAYDWVLFNELFGGALNIPKNVYYIPFDICTLFKIKGIDPDISRKEFSGGKDLYFKIFLNEHNCLYDAFVIKKCYEKLMEGR